MKSVFCSYLLIGVVACGLLGCSQTGDGLVKQAVAGQVLINGKPYRGVIVKFQHTDLTVKGNAVHPVAVTTEDGRFELSTNADKDGAVSGEYLVTFIWNDGATTIDFFRGKYAKPEHTKFRVTIGDSDEDLPPFELEATEEMVQAAATRLNQPIVAR